MFSWFERFKKQDWRLVKTISVNVYMCSDKGKLYYHLHESDRGNRKIEVALTFKPPSYVKLKEEACNTELYQEKIYRWKCGRHDPEIPRYHDIPSEETANVLKGSIN